MYGCVDVQIRPNMEKNRFHVISMLPRHYRTIKGILNPRPFYSKSFPKLMINICDNVMRTVLKKIVVLTQGYHQYCTGDEFARRYDDEIMHLHSAYPNAKIVCVSTIPVDEKIYPGTNEEYIKANQNIEKTTQKIPYAYYVDVYSQLLNRVQMHGWNEVYYLDHFHPNADGYEIIGTEISRIIDKLENI